VRSRVDLLLSRLDEAFEVGRWHSLIGNLSGVTQDDWDWVPAAGRRTIKEIVAHVGSCKLMYEDHAFGDASLRWDQPVVHGVGRLEGPEEARDWLREVQAQVRGSVATLDDEELDRPRRTNWGEMASTLWIVTVIIEHDHYHAGEINHIRSLRQGDRWAYDPPESS
jgi:DinB superfamily